MAKSATQTKDYLTLSLPSEFEGALDTLLKHANQSRPAGAGRVTKGQLVGAVLSALASVPALADQVLAAGRGGESAASVSLSCEELRSIEAAFARVTPPGIATFACPVSPQNPSGRYTPRTLHGRGGQVYLNRPNSDYPEIARVTRGAIFLVCTCCGQTKAVPRGGDLAADAVKAADEYQRCEGKVCALA